MTLMITLVLMMISYCSGWINGQQLHPLALAQRACKPSSFSIHMNFLEDIGDLLTGGKLVPQKVPLPYGDPLFPVSQDDKMTLAIAERPISFTGEDFDVYNAASGEPFSRVRGAMLHLPGKDKMRILSQDGSTVVAELDRKLLFALTTTYDVYRGKGGRKIGWIEKSKIALTDTFEFHVEGSFGPFKPRASFKLQGDFVDRNFVMRNDRNEVVAKVTKDGWVQFDAFNHYQVQVAPGMDAGLVIACACVVDEEFDEEHKAKREQGEGKGGWFL